MNDFHCCSEQNGRHIERIISGESRSLSRYFILLLVAILSLPRSISAQPLHVFNIQTAGDLQGLLQYKEEKVAFISAHRGGPTDGFPENCLATFGYTLRHTHALLEVDPRYTKDSAIVLHHDQTLDRTTTGTGRISDHTLAELRQLYLKDPEGNVTPYRMPTLDEALDWAKGKTILVLDQKDVSVADRVRKIEEHGAEANAMLIVYSYEQAKECYRLNSNIMMEVMIPNRERLADFAQTGVPLRNIVAFVGHEPPAEPTLYTELHRRGVLAMGGTSRNLDRRYLNGEVKSIQTLQLSYQELLNRGVDIVETDIPGPLSQIIHTDFASEELAISKYFRRQTVEPGYRVVDAAAAVRYIRSCRKPGGGFGPAAMAYADLAWTFPAVAGLKLLEEEIADPEACYEQGGKAWIEKAGWKNGPWYWSLHQKTRLYQLLERSGPMEADFPMRQVWSVHYVPRTNYTEFRTYVDGAFFDMASLWYLTEAIYATGGSLENPETVRQYVLSRQAPAGGFEDMLGDRTSPRDDRAHIIVTHHAVNLLRTLDIPIPNREALVAWIQSCQTSDGGFRWRPDHPSPSNRPDVWYTWAAVSALKALGAAPRDIGGCLRWLNSLQRADGGFGDRPGWLSRLYSTYHALDAIHLLTGNARTGVSRKAVFTDGNDEIPKGKYGIFQAHHKAPAGSAEMLDTILAMGLDLIAVKTSERAVLAGNGISEAVRQMRAYADARGYAVEIVDSPENYRHRLVWFSGMPGNHVSNFMIPPDLSKTDRDVYRSAYMAGREGLDWDAFQETVIEPMRRMGTLFYPELDYARLNAYQVYDEGLFGEDGYNAVPAAHFGNYDWVRHFPYKERWIGQLPMIADGDAHGNLEKWAHNLDSFRNLYIAESYRYEDYLEAARNGRSVCVIRIPETGELRYYGAPAAVAYLKERLSVWRWW